MKEKLIEELVSLMTALEQDRKPYESVWDEVTDNFYSKRNFYLPTNKNASRKPDHKYSSRAKRASHIASKGFQGYTADRRADWLQLVFEDQSLMGMYGVQDWLETGQRVLLSHLSRSGFYESLSEAIPDGMNMATASIYSEENVAQARIVFKARHPRATWYAENSFQEVDIAMDEEYMSFRSMVERFDVENLHPSWQQMAERQPFDNQTIRHIVMPMDERYLTFSSGPRSKKMKFVSIWFDHHNRHIIDVGGYWEFPYFVWRYDKSDSEVYGSTCPGFEVIDDSYIANQMTRTRIALGNLIADPPMITPEELEGSDYILPGYHIYTTRKDQKIEPVPLGANYPITTDNEDRIEQAIDAHFNVPIYQMLQQLEAKNKTATEVIEIAGERVALLGPTVGRYELDILQPAVRRSFNLLRRANLLPPPPRAVMDAIEQGEVLKIEFVGRLSQIQKRYYKTDGIGQVFGYIGAIRDVNPDALDNIDFDALTRESLENAGAPASVIREKEDVSKIREDRMRQQQELMQKQEQMATAERIATNADKLGKRPENGSPLEAMGRQA
jgi:hypothetical protein